MTPEPLSEQQIEEALQVAEEWKDDSIGYPPELYGQLTERAILARALLALQARLRESEQARDRALTELASAYPWSRAAAAEQEAGRLREALEEIAQIGSVLSEREQSLESIIARRALAPEAQA